MRLVSLELECFQAHEKTTIAFAPTITTIQGPTDAGKSAILRALRWVCLNDFAGDSFVTYGAKRSIIKLKVTHGEDAEDQVITRTKSVSSTGLNTYHLDGKEFKAFGQGVPSDIVSLLRLNEINFQGQHDPSFWFNDTAGEVSRKLNAVIDLGVIDSALSFIASRVRQAAERVDFVQERIKSARERLEALEPQRQRIEDFEKIKRKHAQLDELTNRKSQLDGLITGATARRKQVRNLTEQVDEGSKVFESLLEARGLQKRRDALHLLIDELENAQAKAKPPPSFAPIEDRFAVWKKAREKMDALSDLLQSIEAQVNLIKRKEKALADAETTFHDTIKDQDCPVCHQRFQ